MTTPATKENPMSSKNAVKDALAAKAAAAATHANGHTTPEHGHTHAADVPESAEKPKRKRKEKVDGEETVKRPKRPADVLLEVYLDRKAKMVARHEAALGKLEKKIAHLQNGGTVTQEEMDQVLSQETPEEIARKAKIYAALARKAKAQTEAAAAPAETPQE